MPWHRVVAVWVALAVVMVVHGTLRERFLTPRLGEPRAHRWGSVTGSLVVLVACFVSLPWLGAESSVRAQWTIGATWLLLTIAFEFGFGHWIAGHPWSRLLADYDVSRGRMWVLVLLATLIGPWAIGLLRASEIGR
jgi:hypothetical protein